MSDFKHKPFTEEWFMARNDEGRNPQEDFVAYAGEYQPYCDDVAYSPEWPLVVYRAEVEWVPHKRVYTCEEGWVEEETICDPGTSKIQRLQAAVREMLYELNIYQEQERERLVVKVPLDTLETYGLTKEDME